MVFFPTPFELALPKTNNSIGGVVAQPPLKSRKIFRSRKVAVAMRAFTRAGRTFIKLKNAISCKVPYLISNLDCQT